MRSFFVPVVLLSATVSSQLVVPLLAPPSIRSFDRDQAPLMDPAGPGPAVPPSAPGEPPSGPGSGGVVLSDVMGRDRSINLFAGCVHIRNCDRQFFENTLLTLAVAVL